MSYTPETLTYDTYERLRAQSSQVPSSIIPRLIILVPSALRLLPSKVRERFGEQDAELYRKNYTVALTTGQGSLSAHTDLASEPMIASEIVKVTHPDVVSSVNSTGKLQRVGSESALNLSRSLEFSYFAVEDNVLYTMKDNDRATLGSNASVRAGFPPAIGDVKVSHEPLLLELMVELAQGIIAKAA